MITLRMWVEDLFLLMLSDLNYDESDYDSILKEKNLKICGVNRAKVNKLEPRKGIMKRSSLEQLCISNINVFFDFTVLYQNTIV